MGESPGWGVALYDMENIFIMLTTITDINNLRKINNNKYYVV